MVDIDITFRRKLRWLVAIRAIVATVLLGGATVAQIKAPGSFPIDPFFLLVALAERHAWFIDVQLVGDAAIVSAFIALTGGVGSFFSSMYALPVVAASMV